MQLAYEIKSTVNLFITLTTRMFWVYQEENPPIKSIHESFKAHDPICFIGGRFFSPIFFPLSLPLFLLSGGDTPHSARFYIIRSYFLQIFFRKDHQRFNEMLNLSNEQWVFFKKSMDTEFFFFEASMDTELILEGMLL